MAKLMSPRLGFFRIPIGVAFLRELNVVDVPENWTEESLQGIHSSHSLTSDLKLCVLYRLRFLSEQHPLDLASLQYCLPLVLEVLNASARSGKISEADEEQVTLALEFLVFQATLCEISRVLINLVNNIDLPRVQVINSLLDILLFVPAVSKLARDAFLQVTDALSANETKEELGVLVQGLLKPVANVRHGVLQSLEPFDLEETDHPDIIFLSLHDSDERNAEVAAELYETNSISLDQPGLGRLFSLLGISAVDSAYLEHDSPYVRETAGKALATALPILPHLFREYIQKLIALYEEKVR
jgi:hypothetical protein